MLAYFMQIPPCDYFIERNMQFQLIGSKGAIQ